MRRTHIMITLKNNIFRIVRIVIGCAIIGFGVYVWTPNNAFNNWYMSLPSYSPLREMLANAVIIGIFLGVLPATIFGIVSLVGELRNNYTPGDYSGSPEDAGKVTTQHPTSAVKGMFTYAIFGIVVMIGMTPGVIEEFSESGPVAILLYAIPLFLVGVPTGLWLFFTRRKVVLNGDTVTRYYVFKKPYTFSFKDVIDIPNYATGPGGDGLQFLLLTKDYIEVPINGDRDGNTYWQTKEILEREIPHLCPWLAKDYDPEQAFADTLTLDYSTRLPGDMKCTTGITLGVLSLIFVTVGLGIICAIPGLIISIMGKKQAQAAGAHHVVKRANKGIATCAAGLALAPFGLLACGAFISCAG